MNKDEIVLGMRVEADDRLVRHVDHSESRSVTDRARRHYGDRKRWSYSARRWFPTMFPAQPVSGVLIGIRHVYETGWRMWRGEEGTTWEPEGKPRIMVLVAENVHRNPARVWLEDLRPTERIHS